MIKFESYRTNVTIVVAVDGTAVTRRARVVVVADAETSNLVSHGLVKSWNPKSFWKSCPLG